MARVGKSVKCSHPGCGNRTLDRSGRCYHHRNAGRYRDPGPLLPSQRHAAFADPAAAERLLKDGYRPNDVLQDGCVLDTYPNDDSRGTGEPLRAFAQPLYEDLGPPTLMIGWQDTRVDVDMGWIALGSVRRLVEAEGPPASGHGSISADEGAKRYNYSYGRTNKEAWMAVDNGDSAEVVFTYRDSRGGHTMIEYLPDRGERLRHHLGPDTRDKIGDESRIWHLATDSLDVPSSR